MKIESVDLFYVSMPRIEDRGDGSQDALLVRVRAGDLAGWGECEASPLVSIASWVCPMSHSAMKPVKDSVLGERVDSRRDIERISQKVRRNSLDLLQADHTLSGVDIALWDLLGKARGLPVYRLIGDGRAFPKIAYASVLFGETPEETRQRGAEIRAAGFAAAKFGWGPYGASLPMDEEHVAAAREGLGADALLFVDAGTAWGEDVAEAAKRIPSLEACGAAWLEEPFLSGALESYRTLAETSRRVPLAGGEGSHNEFLARQMIDHAGIRFIQIDAGRAGGITAARKIVDHARSRGVTYVNHTFTTHLALSASVTPYAGIEEFRLCEYPAAPSELARNLDGQPFAPRNGELRLPERPGLGVAPDLETIRRYLVDVEISVKGKTVYRSEPP